MTHLTKYSLIIFILFSINHSAQTLKSFEVNGSYNFSDSDYLQWSGLRINQLFFNGILDSAKNRIANNLAKNGYYFFEFIDDEVIISSDSASFNLIINLKENNPVIVKNILFEGLDSMSIPEIENQIYFLKGEVFNKEEFEAELDKILIKFENAGYPFSKITISSVIIYTDSLNEENFADIYLLFDKGTESKIDKVEIVGNTSTKDYVIIRELRISPGEIYSQKKIEEFPKRLNRLRFFEPVNNPSFYFNSKNEGILQIEVKEKNTNNFDGIIGYIPPNQNEDAGYITGLVNISLRNLFGTGRAAAIRWNKYDRNSQELDLKYLEPWIFSFPVNVNLNLYQKIQDTTYVQRKFEAAIDYLATEDISASVFISTESVIPTERAIPVFTVYNSSYLNTGIALKIDTRDDPYSPVSGVLFLNTYSYSNKTINGPDEYITPTTVTSLNLRRITLSFYFFYQIFTRQVFAFGVNAKELRGPTFENSELFRLGGNSTLRGYREEQFLGSRIAWSNLEYRFLFTKRTFGFVFFDTGYYLRPEEVNKNIPKAEDFLYGYGVGLNVETGIGVLAVSYALGEGDTFSDGKIHFGIVNEF
jgi:outer membrane protein insertion porin family